MTPDLASQQPGNHPITMDLPPSLCSLVSPPGPKPSECPSFTQQRDISSFRGDIKPVRTSTSEKRTRSMMDPPSPPATPYVRNKKRRYQASEQTEEYVGSSRDPFLFPLNEFINEMPLFGPIFPPAPIPEALAGQHINSHMAKFENKLNKPAHDKYPLMFSFVPIVSTLYNRNPAAWAREERETLERQLVMMKYCRPRQVGAKLKHTAPVTAKEMKTIQPRVQLTSRIKPALQSSPEKTDHRYL